MFFIVLRKHVSFNYTFISRIYNTCVFRNDSSSVISWQFILRIIAITIIINIILIFIAIIIYYYCYYYHYASTTIWYNDRHSCYKC